MNEILPEGARSNGLFAKQWVLVTETTPPIADNLLLALRESGIAAYSLPQTDNPVYPSLRPNSPPTQRVFVDRSKREIAAAIIVKEQAELKGSVDFAEIIGQFSLVPPTTYLTDLDSVNHFEPAEPDPLPTLHRGTRVALVGVLGGPLLLAFIAITHLDPTGFGTWLGLGGFLAGFVTLLLRTKNTPDQDRPDDGAVI